MKLERAPMLRVGDLLPSLTLPSVPDGAPVDLRRAGRRAASVVVLLHGADCPECRGYLGGLRALEAPFREWGGQVVLVVPEALASIAELRRSVEAPVLVLADPEQRVRTHGMPDAGVLIADEWGQLYFVADAGPGHEFPEPGEIAEWLRFVAIQCPECEGPEGEWRTVDGRSDP